MDERRLIIAVALSFVALTGLRLLVPTTAYEPAPAAPGAPVEPATSEKVASTAVQPTPSATPAPSGEARTLSLPRVAASAEQRIEVVCAKTEQAFTNRGARLLSWRLKEHRDSRGRAEEMVAASSGGRLPLELRTGRPEIDQRLDTALFVPSSDHLDISPERTGELRFQFAEGDLSAEKVFRFGQGGYVVDVSASVLAAGQALPVQIGWGPGLGNPSAEEMSVQGYADPGAIEYPATGTVERLATSALEHERNLEGVGWVGVEGHYFAALWISPPERTTAVLGRSPITSHDGKPRDGVIASIGLVPGRAARLYVGPKDYERLKSIAPGLEQAVPVGNWIGPIVVRLMALLRFVNERIGNYGWSIVVLTILINLVMAPLRHYSIANGLKMAKLAPEMRVIQERYRKLPMLDPKRQQMNEEMAALYARHGMSMGTQMTVGCLPILLTMPFLFAVYEMLKISIDLRGAAFLWIQDLSQRDPLFLTPVLMGLSMFMMQKMMPSTMDPAQQRIMLMMPVILTVMLSAAPGGLNLYWLVSNLCSIVQQGVTKRLIQGANS